jgi:hypothetical protein
MLHARTTFVLECRDESPHGVRPDIEIIPTQEDIVSGRDAVLEYVKQLAGKNPQIRIREQYPLTFRYFHH